LPKAGLIGQRQARDQSALVGIDRKKTIGVEACRAEALGSLGLRQSSLNRWILAKALIKTQGPRQPDQAEQSIPLAVTERALVGNHHRAVAFDLRQPGVGALRFV
jgi:hypothetical protein